MQLAQKQAELESLRQSFNGLQNNYSELMTQKAEMYNNYL